MEKLQKLFENQKRLQREIENVNLPADRPDMIAFYALGLYSEIGEYLQADKRWKLWKNGSKTCNKEEAQKELADIWLFLINLTLASDMDVDQIFNVCEQKYAEVLKRNDICD